MGSLRFLALGAVYFLNGRLGTILASIASVSAIWPAGGVGLAGLLMVGPGAWPFIAVAGPVEVLTDALDKAGPVEATALVLVQTGALYLDLRLLQALGFDRRPGGMRDVLTLVVTAGVGSLAAGVCGCLAILLGGHLTADRYALAVLVWAVGDALGLLTVVPFLLSLPSAKVALSSGPRRVGEALTLLFALVTVSFLLLWSPLPLVFLIFPFTWWAAFRFDVFGAAVANVAVTVASVWMTVRGHGPFAHLAPTLKLVSLQTFNASISVASLLLATAVGERRRALDDMRASRTRLVEAAGNERRRLERDLHDGVQQHLVKLSLNLGRLLASADPSVSGEVRADLTGMLADLAAAHGHLRTLAHGIYPAVLTQEGLGAALESLAEQAPLPVVVRASPGRYPPTAEAAVYFVVSEAIANAAKHAQATSVIVTVSRRHDRLIVEMVDGAGGADPARGTGLAGMADRAAALGGEMVIESPPGRGTRLLIGLPLRSP